MATFFQSSDFRQFTASSNQACGNIVLTSDGLAGIVQAQRGIPSGETGNVGVDGIVEITKATASDVIHAGDRIQVSASTQLASVLNSGPPASGSIAVGTAVAASGNGVTRVRVLLNGRGSVPDPYAVVHEADLTFTVAQVNAGADILPAIDGYKYKLVDAEMIAIGGAAATATTVDILGTQAASSVKLVANAVAGLTQNTLLRAGATNSTILAAGASFDACDENTAITINKTGSNVATATSIRVKVRYRLLSE
jgi:predicted RecA/RadA family phage recombinase